METEAKYDTGSNEEKRPSVQQVIAQGLREVADLVESGRTNFTNAVLVMDGENDHQIVGMPGNINVHQILGLLRIAEHNFRMKLEARAAPRLDFGAILGAMMASGNGDDDDRGTSEQRPN